MDKIAGPGSVVEVDEMKFVKRKYNEGRVIEGSWLVRIIDHDTNQLRIARIMSEMLIIY